MCIRDRSWRGRVINRIADMAGGHRVAGRQRAEARGQVRQRAEAVALQQGRQRQEVRRQEYLRMRVAEQRQWAERERGEAPPFRNCGSADEPIVVPDLNQATAGDR
eukprot:3196539-Pyramimonas_sp.AAC.1